MSGGLIQTDFGRVSAFGDRERTVPGFASKLVVVFDHVVRGRAERGRVGQR